MTLNGPDPQDKETTDTINCEHIVIRPCTFLFGSFKPDMPSEFGILANDSEGYRTYVYPVFRIHSWQESPVEFLHEAVYRGGTDFRAMMRRAYEKRKPILVGNKWVFADEYENLFKYCSFYNPLENHAKGEVCEDWKITEPLQD